MLAPNNVGSKHLNMKSIYIIIFGFYCLVGNITPLHGDESTNNLASRSSGIEVSEENILVQAKARVMAGTDAGERQMKWVESQANYLAAKELYYQAYTNIVALGTNSHTYDILKARIFGEYGWFLYQSKMPSYDWSQNVAEGTNLVLTALSICPTNVNLLAKSAFIFADKSIRAYNPETKTGDKKALNTALELCKRAIKLDPNYGYAYWLLGQIVSDHAQTYECQRMFLSLSNHLDKEIWLYDERPYQERLEIARKFVSKTNAPQIK
jgi:hypothetical protein